MDFKTPEGFRDLCFLGNGNYREQKAKVPLLHRKKERKSVGTLFSCWENHLTKIICCLYYPASLNAMNIWIPLNLWMVHYAQLSTFSFFILAIMHSNMFSEESVGKVIPGKSSYTGTLCEVSHHFSIMNCLAVQILFGENKFTLRLFFPIFCGILRFKWLSLKLYLFNVMHAVQLHFITQKQGCVGGICAWLFGDNHATGFICEVLKQIRVCHLQKMLWHLYLDLAQQEEVI